MSQFNENETEAIRGGVMGAIALVSQAEPGFFATFKESVAASNALKDAPEDFRRLMTGGLVMPPQAGSKEEMSSKLLANLGTAVQTASKDPATLQSLQQYVNAAIQEVAQAAKGVSAEETAVIQQVQQVLQQGGQQAQPTGQLQADGSQQAPLAGGPQIPNQAPGVQPQESPFQRPADQA